MYRELKILTARPSAEEEALIPHRLYGTMSASESCSAGAWIKYAKMEIDWALSQNKTPIVTGGTGLYIKALMQGIAEVPEIDPAIRAQAANDYEAMGKEAFSERLRAVDPEFFQRLKVYDRQRLLRSYEVWLGSGKSLSWWQGRGTTPPYDSKNFEVLKVELPREELYRRCDARFLKMLEQGAVEEVRGIWRYGDMEIRGKEEKSPHLHISTSNHLLKIIGVPELCAYLRGEISLDEATVQAQQATRNYAKRQLTWFKNQLSP
jgi:tRNA dimethylallyltransferase